MKNIEIIEAQRKHREFIVHANNVINNVNDTHNPGNLERNIDKDLFGENPLFKCLIAEIDNKPVGMLLYSYFYWANDGQILWISQMFVEESYRKDGVFFRLIKQLKEDNENVKIVSCATGNENYKMQKILKYYGGKEIDLKFYYVKK